MMKNFSKIFALILTLIFSANYYAQCTGCTVTNPVLSGNYTFASGSTVCFTSNATLGDVTFQNNSKICVAPGVTVIIQNNVTTTSGNNITFEVGGTLQFNNPPTFNANLTVNVKSTGTLKSGNTGNGNFTFNGITNNLTNNGTVQVSVLGFNNSSSTNIVDNYGILTIGSNINIQGNTSFRNWNLINIGQSFNMNSSTTYINCGTINTSTGFNVGGGRIINTGNFTISTSGSGNFEVPNGSRIENYGILDTRAGTNNNGTTSVIYNEGLVKFNTYQGDGWLRGPSDSTKKGYFEVASQLLNNSAKVGPNLDFKRTNTTSSQATVFNATPTYVTSAGTTTTQAGANVSFDCRTAQNCSAPLITNIGLCPNIDGAFPPQANDDDYSIFAGTSGSANILSNDFVQYNGAAATTSNVTITQVSTTNTGVNVNTSGIVSVAAGTPAGTYTIIYRICNTGNTTSCDTATITVKVPLDSDGDGITDSIDLDDDNDGILDTNEGLCSNSSTSSIDGFDSPIVSNINGNNIQSTNPYNGWSTETGGVADFNVIRVNGAGYASGPDNAQSGTQYIDITGTSEYVYKNITLTSPTIFSGSAWFANRESSNGGYAPWSTKIEIRNETTGITVAQGNTINFTSSISDEIWQNSSINSVALPAGTYRIRMFVADFGHLDSISYCFSKDTDGDGTPDHLDLDSDNDGCADALEGDENVTASQLTSNRISGTVNANGVPNLVNSGGAADLGSDQGQGIGEAYNAAVQSGCFCYKPAQTVGTALNTNHGITALGRAGADNSNWPMVRKGAWTVLEAKTKGFVVNRLIDAQISAIPSADLREGMMVYNITQDCLQINIDGTASGWKCFNIQACPD